MVLAKVVTHLVMAGLLVSSAPAWAQTRMSDKDVENTMNNLKDDAKRFRSTFNSAVSKSTIRKTTQEKDAKVLVDRFQKQTEAMLSQFKSKKKVQTTLPGVLDSAKQIEKIKTDVPLGSEVDSQWGKVRSELDALSKEFNIASNIPRELPASKRPGRFTLKPAVV